jgi:hypothetical protein
MVAHTDAESETQSAGHMPDRFYPGGKAVVTNGMVSFDITHGGSYQISYGEAAVLDVSGGEAGVLEAPVILDERGGAILEVKIEDIEKIIQEAVKTAESSKTDDAAVQIKIVGKTETARQVKSSQVTVPAEAVKKVTETKNTVLTIETDVFAMTFDHAALKDIAKGIRTGEKLKISVKSLDDSPERRPAIVGGGPVVECLISVGGVEMDRFGEGTVTISIPYTLPASMPTEDYDLITAYYLNEDGVQEIKGAYYDPRTRAIIFKAAHFSAFILGEWINPFADVAKTDWYYKAVRYNYSNALIRGVTENQFSPKDALTRGMLVTVLYRAADNQGAKTARAADFADVAEDRWYADAVAWASANDIARGYGNGWFGVNDTVTR